MMMMMMNMNKKIGQNTHEEYDKKLEIKIKGERIRRGWTQDQSEKSWLHS